PASARHRCGNTTGGRAAASLCGALVEVSSPPGQGCGSVTSGYIVRAFPLVFCKLAIRGAQWKVNTPDILVISRCYSFLFPFHVDSSQNRNRQTLAFAPLRFEGSTNGR